MVVSGDNRETRCSGCSILLCMYGIRQKERNTNKKCVNLFDKNTPHFYGLPLDLCGKCIAALFANAPQFGEIDCGALQDGVLSGIASKCSTHRGISVAHGTPR